MWHNMDSLHEPQVSLRRSWYMHGYGSGTWLSCALNMRAGSISRRALLPAGDTPLTPPCNGSTGCPNAPGRCTGSIKQHSS